MIQIKSDNFRTIVLDIPLSIKGTVGYDPAEDYYTLYINARHCQCQQLLSYFHELKHIEKEDLQKDNINVGYLESIAH